MSKEKRLKKIITWLHLWPGLVAGLIILLVALTGSLLVFENELEIIIFKERHIVTPNGQPISTDSLIVVANQIFPKKKVSRLIIDSAPDHSIEARIGKKGKDLKIAYINPYNGKILYKGIYKKQFFQQVRDLHRYLLLDKAGKVITGISCFICLFSVISGLILWWPANKNVMKQRFKIKWNASGKRLNWDLHAVSGFYLSFFLLLITLTGLVWSYDWVENLLFRVADGHLQKEIKVKNIAKTKNSQQGIFEKMHIQMDNIYPYTGSVAYTIPTKANLAVTLQKESDQAVIRMPDVAFFDSKTGALLKKQPFTSLSTGTKIRKMVLPVHTGSILGWPTKILAFIVTILTASLPVTGTIIWWNKRKKQKNKKSSQSI